jgi:outer membrane biosynthesis protein TonB
MMLRNKTLATTSLVLLLIGSGCDLFHRKKTSPPPSMPPSIDNRKIDLPQPKPEPPPSSEPAPNIQPTPPPEKPKSKPRRNPKKVVVPAEPADATPEAAKPAPDPSINAPMTNAQAEHERQQTTSLLGSAEGNLSNLHRSLSSDEQQMVSQIRNYIAQSRKAMSDGDLERAYNLANKANLLSSELVKE